MSSNSYDGSICPVCGSTNTEEVQRFFDETPGKRHVLKAVAVYCFKCRQAHQIEVEQDTERKQIWPV